MSEQLVIIALNPLTSSAGDSPAKTLVLQVNALAWLANNLDYSSTHLLSRKVSKQKLSSWKMCQDFYKATKDAISDNSSLNWPTQGIATSNGVFFIRSSSESRSVADELRIGLGWKRITDY